MKLLIDVLALINNLKFSIVNWVANPNVQQLSTLIKNSSILVDSRR